MTHKFLGGFPNGKRSPLNHGLQEVKGKGGGGSKKQKAPGHKAMWDWMDKAEGRKDSSWENKEKEAKRQGYK
jgi:hypothetical protein